MDFWITFD